MVKALRAGVFGAALVAGVWPAAALNLPFGVSLGEKRASAPADSSAERPVQMAQMSDAGQRLSQLEEENRRLNGKLEELSFQVLQMQEQMRKMQEDNEFRFQELEGGAAKPAATGGAKPAGAAGAAPAPRRSDAGPAVGEGGGQSASAAPAPGGDDQIGQILDGAASLDPGRTGTTGPAAAPAKPAAGSNTIASVRAGNAGELYGLAYNYLLAGDYQLAENSFRQYTQTYPDAKDVPDARYWLGESLFQQSKFTDAAEVFLNAQKDYPKSPKAPEMMLKLGMSLAKLDNRDTACVTFKEVARRYPQMSATVKRKLQTETQAAKC
ncbi:tol-pal system protein YbgF [Aureimonas endophytica]|uniref:Cell division coordinator CpoB n=1 Tax=Aureimonas endophytica TaxID=2027858 RepID=A0A916ZGH6_9HYPH|nr:tol-pal system protein YbgF [Aureimonas endophytica]GGD94339.1 tol-pal system protein YbgF [Aureimonas endophytica]